jgi:hypothetical protein
VTLLYSTSMYQSTFRVSRTFFRFFYGRPV